MAYPPNTHKFAPQKYLADRPNIWIFRFFSKFFFSKFLRYSLFFGKIFFNKILDTQNVFKHHENFFGEQHNIKELSHKKLLSVHTKGTKKFNFFDFRVLQFRAFLLKKCAFSSIIFFTFFHFSKKKILIFFWSFFFLKKKLFFDFFLILFFYFVSSFIF